APFERRQCAMPRVGPRVPRRMREPRLPRRLANLRIRHVVMDVGELLRERIPRPYALRAAEIRDAGFGRNTRAGQCDDAFRVIDPGAYAGQHRISKERFDYFFALRAFRARRFAALGFAALLGFRAVDAWTRCNSARAARFPMLRRRAIAIRRSP